jgi:LysR family nitrogen assimilation transcriptional regulator
LELRELRYFHSVARAGNFGRAARELNTGQPNVSYQVQKLEQELGTRLLIRHGRGVTLTQAGSCLMERLDVILGLLNAPLHSGPAPERAAGAISLGLPAESAPFLVPALLEECRARWSALAQTPLAQTSLTQTRSAQPGARPPMLTVNVREGTSASLEEWVLDRRIDIALLQDPPALDELAAEPVATERLGLVSGVRAIRVEGGGPLRVRQLAGLKLILPHPRHWIRRLVDSAAFRRGIALEPIQQVDGVTLTKEMVRNGLGCTVLPYVAVRDEVARGTLAFHPIDHDPLLTVHAIVCRAGITPAPFISEARGVVRDALATLVKSGIWAGAAAIVAPAKFAESVERQVLETAIG